jgi:4-aminobutyrate aminotransferase/(S)-3-amino-2-methylpropionate transaminase
LCEGRTAEIIKEYSKYVATHVSEPFPIVLSNGEGVYLTDIEGKRYLDFWSGIATVNVGHGNPRVQDAVRKQMDKLVHCASMSYYSVPALALAKKLDELAPFQPCKALFLTSGSEATDVMLKIARRGTGKHEIITLFGAYHGRTMGAHSITGPTGTYRKSPALGPYGSGAIQVPAPYCYRCVLGLEYPECGLQCAKMIEDFIEHATQGDVAAFFAEPISGVGGIVIPPQNYFKEVKSILDRHEILLVLDEVQTGLGRTGKLWGSETYGVKPDVITLAKALGNGYPISAILAKPELADALEYGDHYSTWGANPVMCAAASATLEYIVDNKLWENAEKMGIKILRRLKELEERYDLIGEARGVGLMIGVEIVKNKSTKEPNPEGCSNIRRRCANSGFIVGTGGWYKNVIRIQPPLIIEEQHVEEALNIFENALK